MANPNVGYATVSVIPTVKGLKKQLEDELSTPFEKAAAEAGRNGSAELRKQFEKVELVDGDKAFENVERAAKQAGADAADGLESSRSEFAAAGRRLSEAAGDELDLTDEARRAAGEVADQLDAEKSNVSAAGEDLGRAAGDGMRDGVRTSTSFLDTDLSGVFGDLGDGLGPAGRQTGEGVGDNIGGGIIEGLAENATEIAGGFHTAVSSIPVPALAVGVAAGAILSKGFVDSLNFEGATAKLRAQLGVTESEAERLGQVSIDIFTGNTGTDIDQVNEAIRRVRQNADAFGDSTGEGLEDVASKALSTANVFDEDLNGVIRATSQLIRTGLVDDSDEAFDLITVGLQGPSNKADDLLDTFNEYSTLFRDLGLDGPTSLGLLNQAIEAGARDSDVAADALGEYFKRATDGSPAVATAFERIGLNADEMVLKTSAGGKGAAEGLQQTLEALRAIEDPAVRTQTAVALFGTQAEDLGEALFAFDTSNAVAELGNLEGAAEDAAGAVGDTALSKFQDLKRDFDIEAQGFWDDILAPPVALRDGKWDEFFGDIDDALRRGIDATPFGAFDDVIAGQLDAIFGINDERETPKSVLELSESIKGVAAEAEAAAEEQRQLAGQTKNVGETAEQAAARNERFAAVLDTLGSKADLARLNLSGAEAAASAFTAGIEDSTQLDDQVTSALALGDAWKELGKDDTLAWLPRDIDLGAARMGEYKDETSSAISDVLRLGDATTDWLSTLIGSDLPPELIGAAFQEMQGEVAATLSRAGVDVEQYLELVGLTDRQFLTSIELSIDAEAEAKVALLQGLLSPDSIPREIQAVISTQILAGDYSTAAEWYAAFADDMRNGVIENPVFLQLMANPTPAEATVDELQAEVAAEPPTPIAFGADTTQAGDGVRTFRDYVSSHPPTDTQIGADTRPAKADVDQFGIQLYGRTDLTARVGADMSFATQDVQNWARMVSANITGLFGFGGFRAGGGPVEANVPYVVGEREAELFVPRTAGTILNQSQIADALPQLGGSTVAGDTFQIYETASPRQTASAVVRAKRRARALERIPG